MAISEPILETVAFRRPEPRTAKAGDLLRLAVAALLGGAGAIGWCLWIWAALGTA